MRYRMDGERHPLDVTSNWEAVEMDIKTDSENVDSFPVFPRSTFLPWTTEGATLTSYLCPVLSDEEFEAQKEQSAKQARLNFFRAGMPLGVPFDYVHPVQEVEAVQKAIYGTLAKAELRREFAARFGLDVEDVDAENARDRARWAEIASLCQPNGGDA
jgi:hypothetical protein